MIDKQECKSAVEAILFASGDPMPAERIALVLGADTDTVFDCASELAEEYENNRRGIRLVRIRDSLQLCSAPEHALSITRAMEQRRPPRLTQTALEVLAIAAYFQPVTRAYIEQVRGVDSSYTVALLTERGLLEPCGKLEAPGRPTLYQTTPLFLRTMGIQSLEELPPLPDLSGDEGVQKLQEAIAALSANDEQMTMSELE
ncbi:MAG: SMC-Scp complex subunit ScpB [Candidatus Heteroscillospira sp.]|jgi:segregation and condensation protein B